MQSRTTGNCNENSGELQPEPDKSWALQSTTGDRSCKSLVRGAEECAEGLVRLHADGHAKHQDSMETPSGRPANLDVMLANRLK